MIAQVTDPQGSRVGLGALLVACYDGSNFVFAGKIGTGFDTALLLDLRRAVINSTKSSRSSARGTWRTRRSVSITVFSLVGARVVRLRTSSI